MNEFKLKNFAKDYPNKIFEYSILNYEDSKWVIANTLRLANLSESISSTQLFYNSIIDSLQNEILYEEEVCKSFLQSVLNYLDILDDSICFVFWDFESNMDLFLVENLLNNWEYIWYATSDEAMTIYFPGKNKLILVTDQGFIKTT